MTLVYGTAAATDSTLHASVTAELHQRGWTGSGVAVGLLDTGIDLAHDAFAEATIVAARADHHSGACRPGHAREQRDHGTHIASMLVGHPGGVAPHAELYAAAVIEAGDVGARVRGGLEWICRVGVSVLCLPIGLAESVAAAAPHLTELITDLVASDVLIVAAAGNGGAGVMRWPGCDPRVLTVGAAGPDGRVAAFSGSSPNWPETGRPGVDLLADGVEVVAARAGGGSRARSGTSQAAAWVAGVAGLLRGAFPEASADQVARALLSTTGPVPGRQEHRCDHGLVRPVAAATVLAHRLTAVGARS